MNVQQWLFCTVTVLFWFSMYTYVPILPLYASSLGASYKLVGLVIGIYGVTQLLLRIPQGMLSDRWRKRKIFVVAAMAVSAASALGMWLVPDVAALVLFRGMSGVAATGWVVIVVLFAGYFAPEEAPRAYGILNSVNFAGQLTGMFAGGLVAEWFGWPATFALAAAGAAAGFFLSLLVKENTPSGASPLRIADVPHILRNFHLLLASVMGILTQVVVYGTIFGFVPLIAKKMGASNFELGLLTTLSVLPSVAASMLSGTWFVRWLGLRRSIFLGFLFLAGSAVIVPFLTNMTQLYCSQLLGGFGRGLAFPLLMTLGVKSVSEQVRATAMGIFQSLYAAGMFAGPVIVGLAGDWAGLDSGFWLCSLCGLSGAYLAWRFVDETGRSAKA